MSTFPDAERPKECQATIWTPIRRELLAWFRREAPSLAPAYEGALRLLHMPGFPGKIHFVSHIVRDIYKMLPEILDGSIKRVSPGEVYPTLIKNVERHWPRRHVSFVDLDDTSEVTRTEEQGIAISRLAYKHIVQLLEKLNEIEKQPSTGQHLARVLHRVNPGEDGTIPGRLIAMFDVERRWFVKRAHLVSRPDKLPLDDGLLEHFEAFERALFSFVGHYFSGTRELDEILCEANETTD